MHSTKQKALSMLIRCFLETASNPTYLNSRYHTALFNHHVLQDSTWPEPDTPPYFSEEFFSIIRNAHLHSSNDVTTMSSSQWYQYLLENQILKTNGSPSLYIPCRAERLTPAHDWQRIWRLARIKGLNSDQSSFLWRLLHGLLPTLDRLSHFNPNTSSICKLCPNQTQEDLHHALGSCTFNREMPSNLLDTLTHYQPNLTQSDMLTLNFNGDNDVELPMVWITSNLPRQ